MVNSTVVKTRNIILLSFALSIVYCPVYSGIPHIVTGKIFNKDGTVPADGAITYSAYITARPSEVQTELSVGNGYSGGYWYLGAGNFPTAWNVGDILHIVVVNTVSGIKDSLDYALTSSDPDLTPDIIFALRVKIKVFLQGPYNAGTGTMNTTLASLNYIPTSQPYSVAPWGYAVTEPLVDTAFYARQIVDWVLVELRSTWHGPIIDRQAALLKKDGTVLCPADGLEGVVFDSANAGFYYIIVRHRNHLSIMTADSISLPNAVAYDLSSAQTKAYGVNPMIALGTLFGMITGDYNASGDISTTDDLYVKIGRRDGYTGYRAQDMDLSGDMNAIDALRVKQGRQNGYQTRVP